MTDYVLEQFYNVLYATLLANCPVDTRNMVNSIVLSDYGDFIQINIEAYYAYWVNYNKQRGNKEKHNFHWVERTVEQVAQIFGANVQVEIT